MIVVVTCLCMTLHSAHAASVGETEADRPWVMSYYTDYQTGYLLPKDVDYSLMTHIVVGAIGVTATGTVREPGKTAGGMWHDLATDIEVRAHREGVKTLLWLGGPGKQDAFKSASSDQYRASFVRNILTLVDALKYDGVDINWEPIRPEDASSTLALVRDLRAARPTLLITLPIDWVPTTVANKKDLSLYLQLASYVDRLFIMSYSMAGPWPGWKSWHGSALAGHTSSAPSSIRSSVAAYVAAGVPKNKLGIGIGAYATAWEHPVRSVRQTLPKTFVPADVHTMSMRTMYERYYSKKAEKWDGVAKVPYLSFKKARGDFSCGFLSYENRKSVLEKARYVKSEKLGGVLVWNIGTDFLPEELNKGNRFPLLRAVRDVVH